MTYMTDLFRMSTNNVQKVTRFSLQYDKKPTFS